MDERLGRKIAEGGCSEVFEWVDSHTIIKLAKPNTDFHAMQREYQNNCIAWESGLPVTKPMESMEIEGRPAIVFERVSGETIKDRHFKQFSCEDKQLAMQSIEEDVRLTARALSEIHKTKPAGSLSSQSETIKQSIHWAAYLTEAEKSKITSIIDQLPHKQSFCHGDPNPGNIIVREDGTFAVIDWMNASIGNPEADLAEYIIMIRYAILPSSLPETVIDYFNTIRESMIDIFMDEYNKELPISSKEVSLWILPMAARKLSADGISEDEKNVLIKEIRSSLSQWAEA
jgi:tRNA A-37 threonylcarbamoyl transferase component Bud32